MKVISDPDSARAISPTLPASTRPRTLFVVEGYTDIRFLLTLDAVCELTVLVPQHHFRESGLDQRLAQSGRTIAVQEIPGGRWRYQASCARWLWRHARDYDVLLTQEMLRGALNATIIGRLQKRPVVTYTCLPPTDYFRCRRERGQINWATWLVGDTIIRALLTINGTLASRCVALGPYLCDYVRRYSSHVEPGHYYGVDTNLYRPGESGEKAQLRSRLGLPGDSFLLLLSSRISHEKDPETVLRAAAAVRARGLPVTLLNLSGGHADFLALARSLGIHGDWVLARPPANPTNELPDYYRAADCVVQGSRAEGLGISPLEALACGVPAVCSAVGGLAANLAGYVRFAAPGDPTDMANQIVWVAQHPREAAQQAQSGRDFVCRTWSRTAALASLANTLNAAAKLRS